jgi:hypothetical protein
MNQFRQVARRTPNAACLGAFWVLLLVIAISVHRYVGLAVLFAPIVLALWWWSAPAPKGVPNVRGENAYQILGVTPNADAATIRRAFRRLQQEYHPDAAPADRKAEATELFIRIGRAYELLSDREKRFQYDGLIHDLDGGTPPFAEAYDRIKDEDKHPIYAEYDALYGDRRDVRDPDEEDEPAPEERPDGIPVEPPVPAPVEARTDVPEPSRPAAEGGEPAGPAVEVEMPEAVREALGLPPTAPKVPRDGGTPPT